MPEPTGAEIEAFRGAWLLADAHGLAGDRTRHGLRAALAIHDAVWIREPGGARNLGEPEIAHEWGYRLADGREIWAQEHSDGAWTGVVYGDAVPGQGQPTIVTAIDVGPETTVEQIAAHLPPDAAVLHRYVYSFAATVQEFPVTPVVDPPGGDGVPE